MHISPRKNISPTPSQSSPNEISSSPRRSGCAVSGAGEASLSVVHPAEGDLLNARCEIAEAYYRGGDKLALAALAASSLRLYGSVVAGDLSPSDLFDDLQECATHLGIAARLPDEVKRAVSFGPRRYAEVA